MWDERFGIHVCAEALNLGALGRSLRRARRCYSSFGQRGGLQWGVTAMTIEDAKQIAHGVGLL